MLVVSLIYLIQRLWLKLIPLPPRPTYDFYRIYDRFTTESWMIEFLGIGCDKAHCLFLSACETEQKKKNTDWNKARESWVRSEKCLHRWHRTLDAGWKKRKKKKIALWNVESHSLRPWNFFLLGWNSSPFQRRQYSEHTPADNKKSMLTHSVIHSVQDGGCSPSIPFINSSLQ